MFNTRDAPMLQHHIEETNSVTWGLGRLIYNKLVIGPVVDAIKNRDFQGNELYDSNAPAYKAALQLLDSELGTVSPVVAGGYQRAREQGMGVGKAAALSFAGFGPAATYTNRTALQNRITELARQHNFAPARPYEQSGTGLFHSLFGEQNKAEKQRDARSKFNIAKQSNDTAGMQAAQQAMLATGTGKASVKRAGMDPTIATFGRLPVEDKVSLVGKMSPTEYHTFVSTNKLVPKNQRREVVAAWESR